MTGGAPPGHRPTAEPLGEWANRAACRGVTLVDFHPVTRSDTGPAKGICGWCHVQTECLDYALRNNEQHGVWGGLDWVERRLLRRRILRGVRQEKANA